MSFLKTLLDLFFSAQEKLFLCGVDVFRLNFSHGEHEEKLDLIDKIRDIEDKYRLTKGHALRGSACNQRHFRIRLPFQRTRRPSIRHAVLFNKTSEAAQASHRHSGGLVARR